MQTGQLADFRGPGAENIYILKRKYRTEVAEEVIQIFMSKWKCREKRLISSCVEVTG